MQIDLILHPLFPAGLFEGREDLGLGNGEAADVEVLAARLGSVLVLQRACYGETDGADCGSVESGFVMIGCIDCCGGAGDVEAESAGFETVVWARG